jgi:hypothetical protein
MAREPNVVCDNCGTEFYKKPASIKVTNHNFCCLECSYQYRSRKKECVCATCGETVLKTRPDIAKSKSGRLFCSKSCAATFNNSEYRSGENHPNYIDGKSGYRERALGEHGRTCQAVMCPMKKADVPVEMVDVHHKDGDRGNNSLDNLVVLCGWCHLLVTRGVKTIEEIIGT